MQRPHHRFAIFAALVLAGLAALLVAHPLRVQAQAPGTQPIPANVGWDQESLNGLNAINNFRAQQTPPLAPLQIDAALQYAAAWEVNDQMTNGNCFGQSGNPQGANYYPYAPATTIAAAICPHTDSLGRGPGPRTLAFGYPNGGEENANFSAGDSTPNTLSKGQSAFQGWYDLCDGDANGNNCTYAHRKGMIVPSDTVIGLAHVCDAFVHRCFWVADFGPCGIATFTPPSGPTPPTAPNPPPACQGAAPFTPPPATLQPATPPTFAGTWAVDNLDVTGAPAGGPLTLTLTGNQATGTYSYADPGGCGTETGTLTGAVSGDVMTYSLNPTGCANTIGTSGGATRLSSDGNHFTWFGGTFFNGTRCGGTAAVCPVVAAATTTTTTQPNTTTTQPTTTTTTQPTTGPTTVTQPTVTTTVTQPTVTTTVTQPTTGPTTVTQPTAAAGTGWAGSWNTDFGPITLTLNGTQASGSNNYLDPSNVPTTLSVNGTANGNTLTGTFGITPPTPAFGGTMTFTLSADGQSFTGTYTLPGNNTGTWNGTRGGP